jgi:hypothetical protein
MLDAFLRRYDDNSHFSKYFPSSPLDEMLILRVMKKSFPDSQMIFQDSLFFWNLYRILCPSLMFCGFLKASVYANPQAD